nr:uncharacterized protein LOC110355446 isoform X2 [Columba livia]
MEASTCEGELEEVAPSPGCAPKTSETPKPMPRKRVTTPPPKEATRDTPPTPQQRTECGAAQNMPREPEEAFDDAFDLFSEDMDDNISLCSTETIAVWPEIRSSSPEMYDELGWPDTDDFGSRTDGGCCCDSCCGGTRNSGLTSSFPGSPRAQTPVFPMSSKKQATTAAKPKKGLQNVVRQREERTASFESHCCCETARVQEAPAPKRPVHCTKQGSSAAVSTVGSTASRHLTAESLGSAREQVSVEHGGQMSHCCVGTAVRAELSVAGHRGHPHINCLTNALTRHRY